MRTGIVMLIALVLPELARAEAPVKLYYVGEAKVSSASGEPMGSQVYLLQKTLDREKATITERAVIVRPGEAAEEWTMRFAVKEDNTFTLSEDSGRATGNGKLFGPAWKWTYFKGMYKTNKGIEIEDENFLADESAGSARQKLTGPDGKVMMFVDLTLKSVTPKTYEILREGLLKK